MRIDLLATTFAVATALSLAACGGPAKTTAPATSAPTATEPTPTEPDDESETPMRMMTKHPEPELIFAKGPEVAPAAELVTWLEAQVTDEGKAKDVKLPVRLTFGEGGLGIATTHVGEMEIDVSDSALGVSLQERARAACPERDVCTMWLIGRWEAPATLHVYYIPRPIAADEVAAATYAEVVVATRPRE
jgi:hypothetical protein